MWSKFTGLLFATSLTIGLQACDQLGTQSEDRDKLPQEGPFGIFMGMPLDALDLGEEVLFGPGRHLNSVPRPHPLLEKYEVVVADSFGVCSVFASSKFESADGSRRAFALLSDQLEGKYGQFESEDNSEPVMTGGQALEEIGQVLGRQKELAEKLGVELQSLQETAVGSNGVGDYMDRIEHFLIFRRELELLRILDGQAYDREFVLSHIWKNIDGRNHWNDIVNIELHRISFGISDLEASERLRVSIKYSFANHENCSKGSAEVL